MDTMPTVSTWPPDRSSYMPRLRTTPLEPLGQSDTTQTFFGPDSTLVLAIKGSEMTFEIHPQQCGNVIVIGREDDSRPGLVDVDICRHTGGQFGVSRQHLMITYNPHSLMLTVMDLNSTNGTWVNGQRLEPITSRVVRQGDELRVGKIVLTVTLLHAFGETVLH